MLSEDCVEISNSKKDFNVVLASVLGVLFESYDFTVYMMLSSILAKVFFDVTNLKTIIYTFAIFAIGYVIRPIGGVVLGHFADKFGRKNVFLFTMFLMMIPTVSIGCIPDYAYIGIWAPILLLFFRALQAVAVGGEMAAAITFIYEHVDKKIRARSIAAMFAGGQIGFLLAVFFSWLITEYYSGFMLYKYAWRWCFYIGGIIGGIGFYFRLKLTETPIFIRLEKESGISKIPILELLDYYWRRVLSCFVITLLFAVVIMMFYMLIPTFLNLYYGYTLNYGLWILFWANVCLIVFIITSSFFIDKWLDLVKKIYLWAVIFLGLLSIPLFYLFSVNSIKLMLLTYLFVVISSSTLYSTVPIIISDFFPAWVRFSGIALSYNLAFAIGGGLTPLLATCLINFSGTLISPAFLIIIAGGLGIMVIVYSIKYDKNKQLGLCIDRDLEFEMSLLQCIEERVEWRMQSKKENEN